MSPTRILATVTLLFAVGIASAEVRIVPQESGVKVRLRGISAVNSDVAWASGREGTVLRTTDGGKHWQAMKVPGAAELDFRDVEGFDADTAVVLSIGPGEASRIYRTEDGGKSWKLALQNKDPRAFFDCMAFDGERGWMMGDPVDGRFQIYATPDAGRSWRLSSTGPKAEKDEAAFAASGTCIARSQGALIVGTGGARSRLHASRDDGATWQASDSGMSRNKQEAGVFSIAATPFGVFAVGGDYKAESAPGNAAEWRLGNKRDPLVGVAAPRGYRSGVACLDATPLVCVAVGPSGADTWDTVSWKPLSDTGYDAFDMVGSVGWASGDAGRIGRVETGD